MIGTDPIGTESRDATIGALLSWASTRLAGLGAAARNDALELLRATTGVERATAFAHPQRALDPSARRAFRAAIERRRCGEPTAYIAGRRGFHAIDLIVDRRVLVPRPESEILVDELLASAPCAAPFSVLDLGTGSGALALAIAAARSAAVVTGTDLSAAALEVARANSRALALEVRWIESDWFMALAGERFDFIVCNPPYVRHADPHMAALVHEPALALDGGDDGLGAIRAVLRDTTAHLALRGCLFLEHGFDQATDVARIAADAGLIVERVVRDLAEHDRVSVMRARS